MQIVTCIQQTEFKCRVSSKLLTGVTGNEAHSCPIVTDARFHLKMELDQSLEGQSTVQQAGLMQAHYEGGM